MHEPKTILVSDDDIRPFVDMAVRHISEFTNLASSDCCPVQKLFAIDQLSNQLTVIFDAFCTSPTIWEDLPSASIDSSDDEV